MSENNIFYTDDLSHSLFSNEFKEAYHSQFGAISESEYIFIKNGIRNFINNNIVNVLEIGFGTGLNALLIYKWAVKNKIKVNYYAIEKYPINIETIKKLNYPKLTNTNESVFVKMHENEEIDINSFFSFKKEIVDVKDIVLPNDYFNFIVFDAFSPDTQPEMWAVDIIKKVYNSTAKNGILSTYSVKGIVKQNMRTAGYTVKRLKGPKGKRHMLNAIKLSQI